MLSIQSADDYYAPGAFRAVADVYQTGAPLLVTGNRVVVDADLNIIRRMTISGDITITNLLMDEVAVFQDATFFSREAYQRAGALPLTADFVADYSYWIKILSLGPGLKINRTMSFYTTHEGQRIRQKPKQFGDAYERFISSWLNSESYRKIAYALPPQIPLASILLRKAYWYNEAGLTKEAWQFIEKAFNTYPICRTWPAFRYATYRIGGPLKFIKHYGFDGMAKKALAKAARQDWRTKPCGEGANLDPQWFRKGVI